MPQKHLQISLTDILEQVTRPCGQEVFSDGYFSRRNGKIEVSGDTEIRFLTDYVSELKMGVVYLKIDFSEAAKVELFADSSKSQSSSNGTFVRLSDRDAAFWLPRQITARDYFENGNIKEEHQAETNRTDDNGFHFTIDGLADQTVELPLVFTIENSQEFIEQITSTEPLEEQTVHYEVHFKYDRLEDVWDYLISGNVYILALHIYHLKCGLRWPCQQTANSLYSHLAYLYSLTGKSVYRFLHDLVAYSVMLRLGDDGRWEHGLWSPEIVETHARFQVNGIFLLADYYKETNREIFLDKARIAMDYLIGLADDMSGDGLWFMHDSLEQKDSWQKSLYKDCFRSTAFGKSTHNTLCLNTHIWTILAFYRLKDVVEDDRYDIYIARAMTSLKQVMQARPAKMIYWLVYKIYDILSRRVDKTKGRIVCELKRRYEKLFRQGILPYLKRKYPRVFMPNGFIERDLTYTCLSNIYHLVTLKDLLLLYSYHPSKWLQETLRTSMTYTRTSGFFRRMVKSDKYVNYIPEMLVLYSSLIDESYLDILPEYIDLLNELGFNISADSVGNVMMISDEIRLRVDDSHLRVFTAAHRRNLLAVIVNPDPQQRKTEVELDFLTDRKVKFKIIDSNDREISMERNIEIPGHGFVKFVRE